MVRRLERGGEVIREGNFKVQKLCGKALVELVLGAFRVVDGGMIAVVKEMTCGYEAVTA